MLTRARLAPGAVRYGKPLSMVMMDMDHFKPYNDHYGHGAGDNCLRRVAKTLKKSISRPKGLVARYGGGEFVALMPDTDAHGALNVAEQLRAAVEALALWVFRTGNEEKNVRLREALAENSHVPAYLLSGKD